MERSQKLRRVYISRPQAERYPPNRIRNTKYTPVSFIPLVLADQFRTYMNLYFLLIAFLQLWKAITPVNPITTWAPLLFVLTVTAVREALDDLKRRDADAAANARPYDVYRAGACIPACPSADICVGDIVLVHRDEELPCDLVLLKTSALGDDGSAKLETANLDGETDLKSRCARPETQALGVNALSTLDATVDCEPPNSDMYRFDAKMTLRASAPAPPSPGAPVSPGLAESGPVVLALSPEQLLQQGTVLRKTRWILGLAICELAVDQWSERTCFYEWSVSGRADTGHDTKMNQSKVLAPRKVSRVDQTINRFTAWIFLTQLVIVFVFGVLAHFKAGTDDDGWWYMAWHGEAAHAPVSHGPPGLHPAHEHEDGGGYVDDPINIRNRADMAAHTMTAKLRGGQLGASEDLRVITHSGEELRITHPWYTPLVLPLRFLLLSSMMIPISLKVTLDLIKVAYAYFIAHDVAMYNQSQDVSARVVNTAVTEDLGRVDFVLTDKTGTLTENRMRLAAVSVDGILHGVKHLLTEHIRNPRLHANVSIYTHKHKHHRRRRSRANSQQSCEDDQVDDRPSEALALDVIESLSSSMQDHAVRTFATAVALCNTVSPEYVDAVRSGGGDPLIPDSVAASRHRAVRYASASPDEEALVAAVARAGVVLCDRLPLAGGATRLMLRFRADVPSVDPLPDLPHLGEDTVWASDHFPTRTYTILHVLEFSSDRRRMSVVVKYDAASSPAGSNNANAALLNGQDGNASFCIESGNLMLLTKGADDVLLARCHNDTPARKAVVEHLEMLAQYGLRTLVVAGRQIPASEYAAWKAKLDQAAVEVGPGRAAALDAVYDSLEHSLEVLGCTAIEDKLQDGVPAAVQLMRDAGIRVWMLTGDKYSTALQIARSANLIGDSRHAQSDGPLHPRILSVRGHTAHAVDEQLQSALSELSTASPEAGEAVLVIEGHALRYALAEHRAPSFIRLASGCSTVICCRSTPSQKAALTSLVRHLGKTVLSIGDGGNDVAMIQAAHVGVGISGREGHQAARAADFAVAQFSHLARLILVHGRLAHRRTAIIAQYTFYKSMCVCAIQMLYNFACAFSGCSLLDTFALTTYNLVYTFIPGLALVLDRDYDVSVLEHTPRLFRASQIGNWITGRTFRRWTARAILQSTLVLVIHIVGLRVGTIAGACADQTTLAYAVFTSLVIIQLATVLIEARSLTALQAGVSAGCGAVYLMLLLLREIGGSQILYGLLRTPAAFCCMLLSITVCLAPIALVRWSQHREDVTAPRAVDELGSAPLSVPPPSPAIGIAARERSVGDRVLDVGVSIARAVRSVEHGFLARAINSHRHRSRRGSSGSADSADFAGIDGADARERMPLRPRLALDMSDTADPDASARSGAAPYLRTASSTLAVVAESP